MLPFWRSRIGIPPVEPCVISVRLKLVQNSGKQRKNSQRLWLFFRAELPPTQDFRRERGVAWLIIRRRKQQQQQKRTRSDRRAGASQLIPAPVRSCRPSV